jgi:AraC-like DNA-binding protein
MDALSGLLGGPRNSGVFLLRAMMAPPWSILVRDRAPLTLVCLSRGTAWAVPEHGEPLPMRAGDVAIMRGPDAYRIADHPDTPPGFLVHLDQSCTTPDGAELCEELGLGVRGWGNAADGPVRMLIGTYPMANAVSEQLLRALPPLAVLREGEWDCPLTPLLDEELARDEPGQDVVLDRMFDLLSIAVLRAWLARPGAAAPGWYRAYGDPVVGRALRLLHGHPAHPWTVAVLAEKTGLSRAALARRFTELVGEPPMAYLTRWRLDRAADLLRDTDLTLAAVARQVGYGSAFALSTAFKRELGSSPQDFRRGLREETAAV